MEDRNDFWQCKGCIQPIERCHECVNGSMYWAGPEVHE